MKHANRWLIPGLILAAAPLAGCAPSVQGSNNGDAKAAPAQVEPIAPGSEISRVTLTNSAMKRLDVQTEEVAERLSPDKKEARKAVPHGALLYDTSGRTWVYTNPKPNTFVRVEVEVDHIKDGIAYLTKGPEVGTEVVTVGVAELYGTETKFGY